MVPVFTAFDHSTYQKVISEHIADIQTMPKTVLAMLQQGAFVVSISGREWHSVSIDEAHEMLINKGCKTALTNPTPDTINRCAKYLPYRAKAIENFQKQLKIDKAEETTTITSPFSKDKSDYKFNENIKAMMNAISKC